MEEANKKQRGESETEYVQIALFVSIRCAVIFVNATPNVNLSSYGNDLA